MVQRKIVGDINRLVYDTLNVFSRRTEVKEMSVFGSIADGNLDEFSDVDIQIVSYDYDHTVKDLQNAVKGIGCPLCIFPMKNIRGNIVVSVLWEDYLPFQKLDLEIIDSERKSRLKQGRVIYQNNALITCRGSHFRSIEFDEDLRHFYDFYIGSIRYLKYRMRSMEFTAYRFYKASIELLLLQYHSNVLGNSNGTRVLGTEQFLKLDSVTKRTFSYLRPYLYPSSKEVMDRLMVDMLGSYLGFACESKLVKRDSKDASFANTVARFVSDMLAEG